jgi:hypothetical protein
VVTGIDLVSADNALNSSGNRSSNKVVPGTNSFEKWVRLRVDVAPTGVVTNFAVTREGDLPDGVTIRFGVTDTPATPVASTSVVATTEMVAGRQYIFDANQYAEAGDHSRYLVFQEQVLSSVTTISIDEQDFDFAWQES